MTIGSVRLAGRRVFITGGSHGLGRSAARRLATEDNQHHTTPVPEGVGFRGR